MRGFALSVSDILPERVPERVTAITLLSYGCQNLCAVCIRHDSRSVENFVKAVTDTCSMWDGAIILETSDPTALMSALTTIPDRHPIVLGADADNMEMMSTAARMFSCPLVVSSDDIGALMDLVDMASNEGIEEVYLDPKVRNMKGCLESNTDIHRLAERLPQADHPILTKAWSGEYALSIAAVSAMRYGSLMVLDDLDMQSCLILDDIMNRYR
ncbi:MAG: hypothetical protein IJ469_03005 [Candidatus Methanomethylophilaceae archaeon]|nr:hypothetical protein [Candidatus Methanomethylophilaceae archaeon]